MKDLGQTAAAAAETYNNPVIRADYSDPDVIAYGDYFYMTASSFQYTPGLPILRSANLAEWEILTYALPEIPEERYRLPQVSQGVWAPSLRVHNNELWIFYGMPDEGIYAVKAARPEGPWSRPLLIRAGKGYIDPCPYWDEAGNAWVIHAYAKSRIGFKSALGCFQFLKNGEPCEGEDRLIFMDHEQQPTLEGPKVYRRGAYYYIFAPAGGVENGWQTVLRSDNLQGPYIARIVLRQGDSPVNGPHQGAWVQDFAGQDWFIHFQDKGAYGRIVHLQPLRWENDWPIIGRAPAGAECGTPVKTWAMPAAKVKSGREATLKAADDFAAASFGKQWQWFGNPPPAAYRMDQGLVLRAQNADGAAQISLRQKANILTQKLIWPSALYETGLDPSALEETDAAGLAILGAQTLSLSLRGRGGREIVQATAPFDGEEEILFRRAIPAGGVKLYLLIRETAEGPLAQMAYEATDLKEILPYRLLLKPHTWTGAKPALFAVCAGRASGGEARFAYFKAEPKEHFLWT